LKPTLNIAGATVNQIPIHWENNTRNIIDAINAARQQKVDILCLPEMAVTGYGSEDLFLSEWVVEQAWQELLKIEKACEDITVAVGLPIRYNNCVWNGACVIRDQRILGITLKQNLALDGVHYEPRWFTPWPSGETAALVIADRSVPIGDLIYDIKGVLVGFEICEDAWRVNRPGYKLAQKKVDLILNPSASHFALGKSVLREKQVVIDGSIQFECAYVFVNLLGNEAGRMIYDGDIIIAQRGKIIALNRRLSFQSFNLLAASIDFSDPSKTKTTPTADTKERNEEFARAASLALFDYLRKSRSKGYVLSLSGGADSSCCAVLVAEMVRRGSEELGWNAFCHALQIPFTEDCKQAVASLLTCAYQSTRNSSEATLTSARQLAESIGSPLLEWSIEAEVTSYREKVEHALGRPLLWETDDIALQNIQARARSPIIWMLANVKQAILLTTSNRSEGDVGYATMDGDTSGSLAPIAGIDKPFILQWLKWAEQHLGYEGLHAVNNLTPTAELRPLERAQTDEKDLMPYPILAEIERLAIYERKSPKKVLELMMQRHAQLDIKTYVKKFFRMWAANQWKRERVAPSFHFDDFNVDPRSWCRFPILSGAFKHELEELEHM